MVSITLPITGVTKRSLVEGAFEAWGRNRDDLTAEETAKALRTLNALMAEWPFSALDFDFPDIGDGALEERSGVDRAYQQAVTLSLALRLAPTDGAVFPADSKAALTRSMTLLTSAVATIPTQKLEHSTVRGSGNRNRRPFINEC